MNPAIAPMVTANRTILRSREVIDGRKSSN
jgi:hypothetical protein